MARLRRARLPLLARVRAAGQGAHHVRQLLAHQAGLHILDEPVTYDLVADHDRLAAVLARQTPAWEPGTRQAYHAITLGFYESELLRRIDPWHRTLGRFFHEEIAMPIVRALHGSELPHDEGTIYARHLEVPSGGAVGTARAIARAYSVFAGDGAELGLRQETLDLLAAPAVPPTRGFYDECMKVDGVQFSLGFMKSTTALPFGSPRAFGSPGAGGALGFADPVTGLGYAYVTNRMGTRLTGDPRDVALRRALDDSLRARAVRTGVA